MLNEIIKKINEQQKAHKPHTPVFYVGEQLKDICAAIPEARELVNRDLDIPEMSIDKCEEKIKAFAKTHGGCTPPGEAHRIICEFYGISLRGDQITFDSAPLVRSPFVGDGALDVPQPLSNKKVNLLDFL